jgi:hypothetical protein
MMGIIKSILAVAALIVVGAVPAYADNASEADRAVSPTLLPLAQEYGRVRQHAVSQDWVLSRRKTLYLQINQKSQLFSVPGVGQAVSCAQFKRVLFIHTLSTSVR